MSTLSLCMIVKNEEDVLARCLTCIKEIADEIIIIDTGSTDKTKEIAAQFTDKLYDFPWCNDFAKARNYSFSKATMDYIMWLDADDILTHMDQDLLKNLKNTLSPDIDMVMIKYDVDFDRQDNPTFSYYRERIFKRSMNYQWIGEIHEVIPKRGNVIHQEISIRHKKLKANEPGRNLNIFETMIKDNKKLDPRQQYYYARELLYNQRYDEAIQRFLQFLEERNGWIENSISACKDLAMCYYIKGEPIKALESLLKSLTFDEPRAEICCEIGKDFFNKGQFETAIFWYRTASFCKLDEKSGAFCQVDCYGYIPFIQMCVCYDRLGDKKKAMEYNEKAGRIKPEDSSYLFNKDYFASTKSLAG